MIKNVAVKRFNTSKPFEVLEIGFAEGAKIHASMASTRLDLFAFYPSDRDLRLLRDACTKALHERAVRGKAIQKGE